ncbi:MAG: hypothetical protein GY862_15495 [Gammaproteobacteria bacterium]|nr:hypothetical protein [Gammaproteobacteria bacterium]
MIEINASRIVSVFVRSLFSQQGKDGSFFSVEIRKKIFTPPLFSKGEAGCWVYCLFAMLLFLSACSEQTVKKERMGYPWTPFGNAYAEIDLHALQTPPRLHASLPELTAYLIKPARNEREKARAIFRWITHNISYNAKEYFGGKPRRIDPASVLEKGIAVCDGYSSLFNQMAKLAGLEARTISGVSKGYAYLSRGRAAPHAWNAVKIDGKWQFMDTTWGAGYLDGNKKIFIPKFEDYYFLTQPDQFIFDHFPHDPEWQLLPHPLSKQVFEQQAYLRPNFFKGGLSLVSHKDARIETRSPLYIMIDTPENQYLSARLIKDGKNLPRSMVSLDRIPHRKSGRRYHIRVDFPSSGDYRLRIFTKRGTAIRIFDWALDYQIRASKK